MPMDAALRVERVWGSGAGNVEVIVNPTLYAGGQITASLQRYLADLQS